MKKRKEDIKGLVLSTKSDILVTSFQQKYITWRLFAKLSKACTYTNNYARVNYRQRLREASLNESIIYNQWII